MEKSKDKECRIIQIPLKILVPVIVGFLLTWGANMISMVRAGDTKDISENRQAIEKMEDKVNQIPVLDSRLRTFEKNQDELRKSIENLRSDILYELRSRLPRKK